MLAGGDAKTLRLALDSSPLWDHGRVEDTFNLLGHAAHQVLACLTELTQHEMAHVMEQIGLSLFAAPSLKAALDIDWGDAEQKQQALSNGSVMSWTPCKRYIVHHYQFINQGDFVMTNQELVQTPYFGQKLGLMYKRWTLDCVVTIAHAVSLDFSDRPELYQQVGDDTATKSLSE